MGARTLTQLTHTKLYSFADADALAGVGRGTSRRSIEGYRYRPAVGEPVRLPPVSGARDLDEHGVSFAELLEIVAIGRMRELGFSLPEVRRVVSAASEAFGAEYPLSELSFKVGGRDVFVSDGSVLRSMLRRRSQLAWDEVLGPFLESLDYTEAVATRWWPLGKGRSIVIDPAYGFGQPIIAGSGVRAEIIRERIGVGDSFEQIAYDFQIPPEAVTTVAQYYVRLAA